MSQLLRETVVDKSGELSRRWRDAPSSMAYWKPKRKAEGNQQPSPAEGGEGSETMHLMPKSLNL